jgi:hypothetical protein
MLTLAEGYPFLQGRAFVFASQFARLLPIELGAQYMDACLHVVESQDAGVPVKVSAIKAIQKSILPSFLTSFTDRFTQLCPSS